MPASTSRRPADETAETVLTEDHREDHRAEAEAIAAPARPLLLQAEDITDAGRYTVLYGYGVSTPKAKLYVNGVDGASYTFAGGVCRNVPGRVARCWLAGGEEENPQIPGVKRFVRPTAGMRVLSHDATERDFAAAVPGAVKDVSPIRAGAVLKGLSPRELVSALGREDAEFLVKALAEELGLHVTSSFTGTSGQRR